MNFLLELCLKLLNMSLLDFPYVSLARAALKRHIENPVVLYQALFFCLPRLRFVCHFY